MLTKREASFSTTFFPSALIPVEILDGPQFMFSTARPCQFANPTKKGPSSHLQDVALVKPDPNLH
jgi:hypothetical protein